MRPEVDRKGRRADCSVSRRLGGVEEVKIDGRGF